MDTYHPDTICKYKVQGASGNRCHYREPLSAQRHNLLFSGRRRVVPLAECHHGGHQREHRGDGETGTKTYHQVVDGGIEGQSRAGQTGHRDRENYSPKGRSKREAKRSSGGQEPGRYANIERGREPTIELFTVHSKVPRPRPVTGTSSRSNQ